MSTLEELLPDITDDLTALGMARRAIRKTGEDGGLRDYLPITAVAKNGKPHYRPYAAAAAWLEANPRWIEEVPKARWRNLNEALAGLAKSQGMLDGAFGLVIPEHLKMGRRKAPGPVFAPTR